MILYTIIPYEVIFGNTGNDADTAGLEIEYEGEKVQVSHIENNMYRINRIISTSPKAYLNPRLQPGNVISMTFK